MLDNLDLSEYYEVQFETNATNESVNEVTNESVNEVISESVNEVILDGLEVVERKHESKQPQVSSLWI